MEWNALSGVAYIDGDGCYPVRVDTAWALLRFFRTGKDWGTEETKRQWAKGEFLAFLERERARPPKPRLVE